MSFAAPADTRGGQWCSYRLPDPGSNHHVAGCWAISREVGPLCDAVQRRTEGPARRTDTRDGVTGGTAIFSDRDLTARRIPAGLLSGLRNPILPALASAQQGYRYGENQENVEIHDGCEARCCAESGWKVAVK